jgi:hypothetical protein
MLKVAGINNGDIYKGSFNSSLGYEPGDAVLFNGAYYVAGAFIAPGQSQPGSIGWIFVSNADEMLFSLELEESSPGSSYENNTHDIAKIEYGSILYREPTVEVSAVAGGTLDTGKYFYVIRYTTNSGAESSDVFVSGGINATVSNQYGGIIDTENGKPSASNTGISINISNIDSSAYGINLYRIHYTGAGIGHTSSLIRSVKIERVNGEPKPISFFDSDNSDMLSDTTDVLLFNQPARQIKVLESKDNILFGGDISLRKNTELDYDVRAFAFDENGEFRYRNFTDKPGETPHMISYRDLSSESSANGLLGKDDHDFINDDIYTKDRYRDVMYRYRLIDGIKIENFNEVGDMLNEVGDRNNNI